MPMFTTIYDKFSRSAIGYRKSLVFLAGLFVALFANAQVSFAQVTLPVAEDAYVDYQSSNTNFGADPILRLRYLTGPTRYDLVYLKFDLSSLPPGTAAADIESASLKLYVNGATSGPGTSSYTYLTCSNWSEATITYNNRPGLCGSTISPPNTTFVAGQYASVDITQFVKTWAAGGGNFGLALYAGSPSDIIFASKESGPNAPKIEVDLAITSVNGTDGLTGGGDKGDIVLSIADSGVTTPKLADGSVTTPKVSDAAITSTKIANGAVINSHLANNSVAAINIMPGSINNLHLADGSVTSNKIVAGSITTPHLVDGSVIESKLSNGAVTNAKSLDRAISTQKHANGAVGTTQIANADVQTQNLADSSVVANKIASGQVVKSLNGLTDAVNLAAGANVNIEQSGNTLTISASGASSQPTYNPLQVAQLRWWGANQSGASFAVGNQPYWAAFDGSHIWVSNAGDGTVTKLRTSDGANLGTFSVGPDPRAVAFDGKNIWVANFGSNSVSKLSASDGTTLETIIVGDRPWGLAFDGTHVWVACYQASMVVKIRASDNQIVGTVSVANPLGLAFDGNNIWAALNLGSGRAAKISGTGAPTVLGEFGAG